LDSSIVCQFLKVNGPIVDNLSIDTCWLSSPVIQKNETILLNVQISNYSDNDYEDLNLELMINGQPKGISSFNISSFDKSTTSIQFTLENSGLHTCELKLGGDLIPTDDQLYFNFYIKEQHQIVCISENINPFVDAIFQDNPGFAIQHSNYGNINYSNFKNSSLIVINEPKELMSGLLSELDQYLKNGGNVVIFPHASEPFGGLKNMNNSAPQPFTPTEPHHSGHRDRLRERFIKGGVDALQDYEILEMILFIKQERHRFSLHIRDGRSISINLVWQRSPSTN
jgi:hypothetical protein